VIVCMRIATATATNGVGWAVRLSAHGHQRTLTLSGFAAGQDATTALFQAADAGLRALKRSVSSIMLVIPREQYEGEIPHKLARLSVSRAGFAHVVPESELAAFDLSEVRAVAQERVCAPADLDR
jgi:hypothetical protein